MISIQKFYDILTDFLALLEVNLRIYLFYLPNIKTHQAFERLRKNLCASKY
jgi:hypothetical protein